MQRLEVSGAVRPIYGSLGVKGSMLTHLLHFAAKPRNARRKLSNFNARLSSN